MTEKKGDGGGWTRGCNLRERRWQDGRSGLCAFSLHVIHISDNLSGMGSSRSSASGGFGGPDGSGESSSVTGSTRRRRTGNLRKGTHVKRQRKTPLSMR